MISITTVDYSAYGPMQFEEDLGSSAVRGITRRLSRSPTLDGGTVLDDAGFSDGDRTIDLTLRHVTQEQFETLRDIASLYSGHRIVTADGSFLGGIESLNFDRGSVILRFLVESKASA